MDEAALARRLRDHLRRCGVVVHLVSPAVDGLVVFLAGALGQHEKARTLVLRFPEVAGVRFLRASKAVMFVDLAPAAPSTPAAAALPGLLPLPASAASDCYGSCSAVA